MGHRLETWETLRRNLLTISEGLVEELFLDSRKKRRNCNPVKSTKIDPGNGLCEYIYRK